MTLRLHWTEALLNRIERGEEALVPAHWPLEIANTLLVGCRRGRITRQQLAEFLGDLAVLPIRFEPPPSFLQLHTIVTLAEQYHLTAYDAAYLELAQRTGLPLATLDNDLRKAAQAEGAAVVT